MGGTLPARRRGEHAKSAIVAPSPTGTSGQQYPVGNAHIATTSELAFNRDVVEIFSNGEIMATHPSAGMFTYSARHIPHLVQVETPPVTNCLYLLYVGAFSVRSRLHLL